MLLSLLLYVISICEVECGQFEVRNNSVETQQITVSLLNNEQVGGTTIAAGEADTLRLAAGKYRLAVSPADEHYRVTAQDCGGSNLCPLSLPHNIQYVDMGLPSGTYWANMNLGATEPYECGCYFAWAEVTPKETYTWENYKWILSPAAKTTTKYNYNASWGTPVDGKMKLDPEDDAAHVHWGNGWQIPDMAAIEELIDNVTFSVEVRNGQRGMKVVSKINGNELFFPFAGQKTTSSPLNYNNEGVYASSELTNHDIWGYYHVNLQTYLSPSIRFRMASYNRGYHSTGFSVRPVFKGTPPPPTPPTPPTPPAQLPVLSGPFSVSDTKTVRFAPGNLQYQASTGTWRFAEHQYDVIGDANMNISATYDGWIDCFGWTTSGYNGHEPWLNSTDASLYYSPVDIDGTEYDWGVHNAISNGGNTKGEWRLLSVYELAYLFGSRTNAANLRGAARVNGLNGYVLLPDNWVLPAGLTFLHDPTDFTTTNCNIYTAEEWEQMEAAGAVFLPAGGVRDTWFHYFSDFNNTGFYWTSSFGTANESRRFMVLKDQIHYNSWGNKNYLGMSVRLVQDVTP